MPRSFVAPVFAFVAFASLVTVGGSVGPAVAATADPSAGSAFQDYAGGAHLARDHADVFRLYWAFFDREPDVPGAHYWAGQYDQCTSLLDITWAFGASDEFTRTYGLLTDAQFMELIYRNVLDRAPDPVGRAYWADLLADGTLIRAEVMLYFSLSDEFRQAHPLPSDGRSYPGCALPSICHPDYVSPCLPITDDLNCPDVGVPVMLRDPEIDPYELDLDEDGTGCQDYE